MSVQEGELKFEINELSAGIVKANNAVVDAKKIGGDIQVETLKRLTDILANNGGAIEVFRAIQGK